MLEDEIEAGADKWATDNGWFVRKLRYPGRRGAPDKLYVKDGRVIFVEWKKPDGRRKGLQKREIRKINDHGGEAYFLDSVKAFIKIATNGS